MCQMFQSLEGKDWVLVTSELWCWDSAGAPQTQAPTHPWCGQHGLTSVSSGSSVSSAGPGALLSARTSWSWRSGWELPPRPRSAAGNGECRRSWSHTSAQSKHSRRRCWHRRQNTSHRAHIAASRASSARATREGWWRRGERWDDRESPKQTRHQQELPVRRRAHRCGDRLPVSTAQGVKAGGSFWEAESRKQSTCSREKECGL